MRVKLPPCPDCGSDDTSAAYSQKNVTTFCCPDCGHTWRVEHLTSARPDRRRAAADRRRRKKSRG